MPDLLIIPPLSMHRAASGRFVLTRKFLDGLAAYAHYFPGKVTALITVEDQPTDNLDNIEMDPKEHPFEIRPMPQRQDELLATLQRRTGTVVLGSLSYRSDVELARICAEAGIPIVLVTEYALQTRRQIIDATVSNPLRGLKRKWSEGQMENGFRKAAAMAAGLQCNGTPTYDDYHGLNPKTLLFFDTRIRHAMLPAEAPITARIQTMQSGAPLRLAFSGRLIKMKGADYLPAVAAELKARNVPFTLDICGGGELEGTLAAQIRALHLADVVRFRGNLDFARELVPLITDQCDLFIQCHPQGDPSCTYLETMACAVPIAGYDNAAFAGIVRSSKVGFPTPLGDAPKLAAQIAALHADRPQLATAAWASLHFAAQHTFERTMQQRVAHLLSCMETRAAVLQPL